MLAEALAREVARAVGPAHLFEGRPARSPACWARLGIDTTGVELDDTSRASSTDRVPPTALLGRWSCPRRPRRRRPAHRRLRHLLTGCPSPASPAPSPTGTGTRVRDGPGWVRAKTGSLTGGNALAGFVPDVDGRLLVFAFMRNGVEPGTPGRP